MAIQLGIVVTRMPELATTAWYTVASLVAGVAAGGTPVLAVVSAAVQILFLLLPLAGAVLGVRQLLSLALRLLLGRRSGRDDQDEQDDQGTAEPAEAGSRMPVPLVLGGLAVSTVLALGGIAPARSPGPTAALRGRSHASGDDCGGQETSMRAGTGPA
ncbi:hypothetical protein [Streptomyces sp. NRRL S-813]|uniref:hypothetical protein n=1 Tax=Streptomyces sp. NRRL S-813 TaxID=1463919 RepID=UPI000AE88920|nr:hypothetical protein [Streptomyces sp. NRRL S-813]